jgi:GH24 family phage-related lysozyme (muramidase)
MANENMHLSAAGYGALRANEGVVMHYYNDAPVNGNCTWGVGTLAHYGPCTQEEMQRTVLPQQVDAILQQRVLEAERIVRATVRQQQLTQAQFDAAVSFAYNSTTRNIRDALSPANTGNMTEVVRQMRQNVMIVPRDRQGNRLGSARVSPGLVHRREREVQPFLGAQP